MREAGEPAYVATHASLIAHDYALTRIIPAFIDVPPGGAPDPAVREFLRFLLSREGQQALIDHGWLAPDAVVVFERSTHTAVRGASLTWVDGITAGYGWIAIALVIFAFWRPTLCLVGAYLFGAFAGIPFTFQARGILTGVPPELFQALPYVMTIVVLVLVSASGARRRLLPPLKPYSPTSKVRPRFLWQKSRCPTRSSSSTATK